MAGEGEHRSLVSFQDRRRKGAAAYPETDVLGPVMDGAALAAGREIAAGVAGGDGEARPIQAGNDLVGASLGGIDRRQAGNGEHNGEQTAHEQPLRRPPLRSACEKMGTGTGLCCKNACLARDGRSQSPFFHRLAAAPSTRMELIVT